MTRPIWSITATIIVFIAVSVVLAASGCVENTTEPIETTMRMTFDTVPHQYYSQDPVEFIAVNVRSEVNPPQIHHWCLGFGFKHPPTCGKADKFQMGGHRFYLQRDQNWDLALRTWTEDGQEWMDLWSWSGQKD